MCAPQPYYRNPGFKTVKKEFCRWMPTFQNFIIILTIFEIYFSSFWGPNKFLSRGRKFLLCHFHQLEIFYLSELSGEQGEAGLNGTEGQMGRRGIQGPSGEPGLPGLKGDKGDRGEPLIVDQFLSNCSCEFIYCITIYNNY